MDRLGGAKDAARAGECCEGKRLTAAALTWPPHTDNEMPMCPMSEHLYDIRWGKAVTPSLTPDARKKR